MHLTQARSNKVLWLTSLALALLVGCGGETPEEAERRARARSGPDPRAELALSQIGRENSSPGTTGQRFRPQDVSASDESRKANTSTNNIISADFSAPDLSIDASDRRTALTSRGLSSNLSVGLEHLQRRPVMEAWVLNSNTNDEYVNRVPRALVERIKRGIEAVSKGSINGPCEIPYDSDQDGVPDLWFYAETDKLKWAEADLKNTRTRDFRVQVTGDEWEFSEAERWFLTPPVPIKSAVTELTSIKRLLLAAYPDPAPLAENISAEALLKVVPDLDAQLTKFAAPSDKASVETELADVLKRLVPIVDKYRNDHLQGELAEKLKHVPLTGFARDMDGEPGDELMVHYTTRGIERIDFVGNSRPDRIRNAPISCEIRGGQATQIRLQDRVFLRHQRQWLMRHPEAPAELLERCFGPAFERYLEREWYAAVEQWRIGLRLKNGLGLKEERDGREDWVSPRIAWPGKALVSLPHEMLTGESVSSFLQLGDHIAEAAPDRAMAIYQLRFNFAEKFGHVSQQCNALEHMSLVHQRAGRYDRAIDALFRAQDLESTIEYAADVAGHVERLAQTEHGPRIARSRAMKTHSMTVNRACRLGWIAALYGDLGDWERAESYLTEAARLFVLTRHVYGQADMTNLRARIDLIDGRWKLARSRLERSLQAQVAHTNKLEAELAEDVKLGRESSASRRANLAEHIYEFKLPNEDNRLSMLGTSSPYVYQAATAALLGEAALQGSLSLRDSAPDEASRLSDEANRWYRQSIEWHDRGQDSIGKSVVQLRQAELAWHRREYDDALRLAREVEVVAKERHVFETRWRALFWQALANREQQNFGEARRLLELAAREIEAGRANQQSEPTRSGYFTSKRRVHEELVALLVSRGEHAAAWEWIERAKARTFLDLVAQEPVQVSGSEADEWQRQRGQILSTIGQAGAVDRSDSGQAAALKLHELFQSQPRLREVASLAVVQPVSLTDLQATLGSNTLLVEYFETDDDLYVVSIGSNEVRVRRVEKFGRRALLAEVEEYRALLQEPGNRRYAELAQTFYSRLIGPELATAVTVPPAGTGDAKAARSHVCVVPTAALHYLPFQTLMPDSRSFLISQHDVSYAASASALVYARERHVAAPPAVPSDGANKAADELLIVANPEASAEFGRLPFSSIEGRRIRDLSQDATLLEGAAATEAEVVSKLKTARCFHFAGHTQFVPTAPLKMALLCTADAERNGRLEVQELFSLNLRHCDLAVLSACETQLGRLSTGDEIVGLSRAFLRAGVPTVVSSLWKVPDEPTCRMMVRFHQLRRQAGLTKGHALSQAQREFLAGQLPELKLTTEENALLESSANQLIASNRGLPTFRQRTPAPPPPEAVTHPFYWASFCLVGDWK